MSIFSDNAIVPYSTIFRKRNVFDGKDDENLTGDIDDSIFTSCDILDHQREQTADSALLYNYHSSLPLDLSVKDEINNRQLSLAAPAVELDENLTNSANIALLKHNNIVDKETIEVLQRRLWRRTMLLQQIRSAYLRDVVSLKHVLDELLVDQERQLVINQYLKQIPTVDIREILQLHGPQGGELKVKPCVACGGYIDVVIDDKEELIQLQEALEDNIREQNVLRVELATKTALADKLQTDCDNYLKSHELEKRYLYNELRSLREEKDEVSDCVHRLQLDNGKIRSRENQLNQQIMSLQMEIQILNEKEQDVAVYHRVDELEAIIKQQQEIIQSKVLSEESYQEEIQKLLNEKNDFIGKYERAIVDTEKSREDVRELKDKMIRIQEMTETLQSSLQQSNEKTLELELQLSALREEKETMMSQYVADTNRLELSAVGLRQDLRDTKAALQKSKVISKALKSQVEVAQDHLEEMAITLAQKDNELIEATAFVEDAQAEIQALKAFLISKVGAPPSKNHTPSGKRRSSLTQLPLLPVINSSPSSIVIPSSARRMSALPSPHMPSSQQSTPKGVARSSSSGRSSTHRRVSRPLIQSFNDAMKAAAAAVLQSESVNISNTNNEDMETMLMLSPFRGRRTSRLIKPGQMKQSINESSVIDEISSDEENSIASKATSHLEEQVNFDNDQSLAVVDDIQTQEIQSVQPKQSNLGKQTNIVHDANKNQKNAEKRTIDNSNKRERKNSSNLPLVRPDGTNIATSYESNSSNRRKVIEKENSDIAIQPDRSQTEEAKMGSLERQNDVMKRDPASKEIIDVPSKFNGKTTVPMKFRTMNDFIEEKEKSRSIETSANQRSRRLRASTPDSDIQAPLASDEDKIMPNRNSVTESTSESVVSESDRLHSMSSNVNETPIDKSSVTDKSKKSPMSNGNASSKLRSNRTVKVNDDNTEKQKPRRRRLREREEKTKPQSESTGLSPTASAEINYSKDTLESSRTHNKTPKQYEGVDETKLPLITNSEQPQRETSADETSPIHDARPIPIMNVQLKSPSVREIQSASNHCSVDDNRDSPVDSPVVGPSNVVSNETTMKELSNDKYFMHFSAYEGKEKLNAQSSGKSSPYHSIELKKESKKIVNRSSSNPVDVVIEKTLNAPADNAYAAHDEHHVTDFASNDDDASLQAVSRVINMNLVDISLEDKCIQSQSQSHFDPQPLGPSVKSPSLQSKSNAEDTPGNASTLDEQSQFVTWKFYRTTSEKRIALSTSQLPTSSSPLDYSTGSSQSAASSEMNEARLSSLNQSIELKTTMMTMPPSMFFPAGMRNDTVTESISMPTSVPLLPVDPDTTLEELLIREQVLSALLPLLGENMTHSIMNALHGTMHTVSTMLTESLQSMWALLLMSKRSMDFCEKIKIVFDRIMQAAAIQGDSLETKDQIAEICTEIVPLVGSLIGTKLTPLWQEPCNVSDDIISELLPSVDPVSGQLTFKSYESFFHVFGSELDELKEEYQNIAHAKDSIDRMCPHHSQTLDELSHKLLDIVHDWVSTKDTIYVNERNAEMEIEATKKELQREIDDLEIENTNLIVKIEGLTETIDRNTNTSAEQAKTIHQLEKLVQINTETEMENQQLKKRIAELDASLVDEKIKEQSVQRELHAIEQLIESKSNEIQTLKQELMNERNKNAASAKETKSLRDTIADLEKRIVVYEERLGIRKLNVKTSSTQSSVETKEDFTQTDFLVPPMSLKTILAAKNNHIRNFHPEVFPHADPTYQDILLQQELDQYIKNASIDTPLVNLFPDQTTNPMKMQRNCSVADSAFTSVMTSVWDSRRCSSADIDPLHHTSAYNQRYSHSRGDIQSLMREWMDRIKSNQDRDDISQTSSELSVSRSMMDPVAFTTKKSLGGISAQSSITDTEHDLRDRNLMQLHDESGTVDPSVKKLERIESAFDLVTSDDEQLALTDCVGKKSYYDAPNIETPYPSPPKPMSSHMRLKRKVMNSRSIEGLIDVRERPPADKLHRSRQSNATATPNAPNQPNSRRSSNRTAKGLHESQSAVLPPLAGRGLGNREHEKLRSSDGLKSGVANVAVDLNSVDVARAGTADSILLRSSVENPSRLNSLKRSSNDETKLQTINGNMNELMNDRFSSIAINSLTVADLKRAFFSKRF